jgi:hypothetical protein
VLGTDVIVDEISSNNNRKAKEKSDKKALQTKSARRL